MPLFRRTESRKLTVESLPPSMLPSTVVGEGVSARNALAISSVFGCLQCLTSASLLCPLQVYRKQADGTRQQVTTGKLTDLLTRPAPAVTGEALTARLMQSLALHGEAMLGKYRTDGQITSLGVLDPLAVTVSLLAGQPRYRYSAPDGTQFENLTTSDIVHVVGVTDQTGIRGLSPIACCREALGLASALTTSASAQLANGSIPSGILSVPPGPTAQDQATSLSKAWSDRQGGPQNRGRVAVLSGDIGWTSISLSPEDAQFVQQAALSLQEIARLFGIPPSRINAVSSDSMTYSTTMAEATAFVQQSLGPRLKLIESAVSNDPDLCSAPVYVEYNLDGLLRGDSTTRAANYTLALNPATGWMTRREVRDLENLPREQAQPAAEGKPPAPPGLAEVVNLQAKEG